MTANLENTNTNKTFFRVIAARGTDRVVLFVANDEQEAHTFVWDHMVQTGERLIWVDQIG